MEALKRLNIIRSVVFACTMMAATLGLPVSSSAQSKDKNLLLQMIEDDHTTIDAIAGTDEKVRHEILQVAKTPEILDQLADLQMKSQEKFRGIIKDYDRSEQASFYDLARYPDLISELAHNGRPSSGEAIRTASKYPEEIRGTAIKLSQSYPDALIRIDRLNNAIDLSLQQYLGPYSVKVRESVAVLLSYPDIVASLVEDRPFTSLLGVVYGEDPEWAIGLIDRISHELAEQNREDLDAYKTNIQKDPDAYKELLEASNRYERENNDLRRHDNPSSLAIELRVNSFPFWFGYPYWYSSPIWYPYPIRYHTGFYRNNIGNIVFVGLPSYHFIHWQSHFHPSMYPHLTTNYYNFYQNHYALPHQKVGSRMHENGFYKSVRANVANNPRVNNSARERNGFQRSTPERKTDMRTNGATIKDNNRYIRPQINEGGYRKIGVEGTTATDQKYGRSGTGINRATNPQPASTVTQRKEGSPSAVQNGGTAPVRENPNVGKPSDTRRVEPSPSPPVKKPTRAERKAAKTVTTDPPAARKEGRR